ncbi:RNA-dependent RNA polymerase 1 [Prunus dulcis]|uniref:RNA-dependent RNA polymerase n=1 Tax=Prunus dulcis TaxID=3755 RepID=A0A5H2XJ45_PRUDU|nr:RNA-dependent RNA polymerase 1 [Prunus dulcis]
MPTVAINITKMVKTIQLYGFSSSESPAAVTEFLEAYTGKGTVHAIKFLPPKDGKSRTLAIVQFTDAKFAGIIIPLADARSLWYNKSYLKARKAKFDMVPNSEIFEHCMELVQLHLGCQISEEQFSVLWARSDVLVKFGVGLKNIYLFFSYDSVDHKLEITSENVSQIELHHPRGQLTKFLLIQLIGAPRIFKKASGRRWVRGVDFTPTCCIGQSSAVCLELPPSCELPNLRSSFVHYKENEGPFFLERARKLKLQNFEHSMELVKLHLGCLISEGQFSVLWTALDVSVKFGKEFKNIYLLLSLDAVEYKLEISSESIRQIELHHPHGQLPNFLLIQLLGAPRIFKKASQNGWVREVDFTPSRCIGQSSVVCLELPPTCELPNLRKIYAHYKENEGQLVLERGNTFSCTSDLVPIVGPPLGINLPYKILFKINSLVQHGCVPGQALDVKFYELVDPSIIRIEYIECALDKLFRLKGCCYEPVSWLTEQYREYMACKRIPQSPAISLDDGMVYVHRVQVTPSKVYFCGPEANVSNRVLRNYPEDVDNFLRVSFVDEDMGKMRSGDLCPRTNSTTSTEEERRTGVYERILSTLRNGIVIGEKKFEFLAHSSSQLREHSVWMFASRSELTAQDIRNWMAKHAARLGQAFSSSRETFDVGEDEIEFIPDVKTERGGVKYCFSDGIGKISAEFAGRVASKCGTSTTPSAFQIRLGGYKGVVAVDPTLSKKLALRDSMCKYQSNNTKLDVLAWSRYQPCFLNRQLITLLSTLGVPDLVFVKKQNEALKQLEGVLADPSRALEALEMIFQGEVTDVLKEMLACGYEPDAEPFLVLNVSSSVAIAIAATSSEDNFIVEGNVVVAKNPCLHPGDVRVLRAVNVLALHHMVDCVVFPQKGNRPHPNECSGSDLDGDVYFVSWDPDLIPPWQVQPMNYTPAPTIELDHDVTMEEVTESFTNYIVNDNLGIICNAHTVFADTERQKATSAPVSSSPSSARKLLTLQKLAW